MSKADTIKRCEYSPLGKELKAQTYIEKDEYKFFKDQKSRVVANKKEDMIDKVKSDDDKSDESQREV